MHKRILILTVVVLVVAVLAWAGGNHAGKMMSPAEHAAKLQKELGLTDAQTQQVRAVLEESQPQMDALKERAAKGENVTAEKKKLKEERNAKLKAIFTAEQWTKYEQLMTAAHPQEQKKP